MKISRLFTVSALLALEAAGSQLEKSRTAFLEQVLNNPAADQRLCKPTGLIQDACCDFETVESVNEDIFQGLDQLVKTPYFRYHQVELFRECPFWREDGTCANRACSVETTDENHIPEAFRSKKLSEVTSLANQVSDDSNFCVLDDGADSEGVYVDLRENPERFTGYAGPSANRVWKAIYEENCFAPVAFIEPARGIESGGTGFAELTSPFGMRNPLLSEDRMLLKSISAPKDTGEEICLEKRVFYRLISGLHTSISVHICDEYLDQWTGKWSPNLNCFITRIGQHPERLENLYFTYVVALRALAKSGPQLLKTIEKTDSDGGKAGNAIGQLSGLINRANECGSTFDEGSMFSGPEAQILKSEFKEHFRNVSRIMDCVGCDKCRLWGKLQVTGLGTALKLLFSNDPVLPESDKDDISRGELVSFINGLHRLSESLAAIDRFRTLWHAQNLSLIPGDAPVSLPQQADPKPVPSSPEFKLIDKLKPENGNLTAFARLQGKALGVLSPVVGFCRDSWNSCHRFASSLF